MFERKLARIQSDWMNRSYHNELKDAIETLLIPNLGYALKYVENFKTTLKVEMVEDLRYFNSLEKEVEFLNSQLKRQKLEFSKTTDRLLEEHLFKDIMCAILRSFDNIDEQTEMRFLEKATPFSDFFDKRDFSNQTSRSVPKTNEKQDFPKPATAQTLPYENENKGVTHTTSVSRPQIKSIGLRDKVLPNNSKVKNKSMNVEEHCRNFKFSNNTKSVTACNDGLRTSTLNVNFVCATCGKCVLNDNHDACVVSYINDVNSRTKKPFVVPISASEPKRTVNQSVATPHKKTIASDSTIRKYRSRARMIYENVSKTCKWWYTKITPLGYKWIPKSRIENVNTSVSKPLDIKSRLTNISEPTNDNGSNLSSFTLSFNSFAANRNHHIHRRLWVLKAHDAESQASH
ncbi:hypothetical protein Tco_0480996 [Tanacetum coccineum]